MEREVVLKLWVGYRLLEKGIKKKKIQLDKERLEKTLKWNVSGKCQAVWFIWAFGGMTKDLSLRCIMQFSSVWIAEQSIGLQ